MQIGGGSNFGMQVGSSMGNIAVKPKTSDSPKVEKTSSVPTGDSSKTKAPKGGDTVVDTSSDTQGLTEPGGDIDSTPDLNEDGMGEIGDGIEGEDTGLDGMDTNDLEVEMEDEGLDVEVDEMDEPDVEDPSVDEPDGPDDPEVDDPSVDEPDDPDDPDVDEPNVDEPNNDETDPTVDEPKPEVVSQGNNDLQNLQQGSGDAKKGLKTVEKGLDKQIKTQPQKTTLGHGVAKKTVSRSGSTASVVSSTANLIDNAKNGDVMGVVDSGTDIVKDGGKALAKDLSKTKFGQAVQLKGVAKSFDKVSESLVALVENPTAENLDKFASEVQGLISNVDGAKELAKGFVEFAKKRGPAFAEQMGKALVKAEGTLAKLAGPAGKVVGKAGMKTALRAMGGPAAAAVAALDLGRAVVAGVEAVGDPTNPEKVGQAIKRMTVAAFSTASVLPGASWGTSLAAAGAELIPDSAYAWVAEQAISLFDTPKTVTN